MTTFTYLKELPTIHMRRDFYTSVPMATRLITMTNNKSLVLYDGYTFYKRLKMKKFNKWNCTSLPRCTAFLHIDDNFLIIEGQTDHNHNRRSFFRTSDGLYARV